MKIEIETRENSRRIRIPKELLTRENIVIPKAFRHKTLEQRVMESGKQLKASEEIDMGAPKGSEVW